MSSPFFNFVVALPAESKPLIAHFGLKRKQPDGDFPLYQNGPISLVLSGVGKGASAQATRFLLESHNQPSETIWINLGIAGHATRTIGDMILAQSILDEDSLQHWTMPPKSSVTCELETLTTVSQPEFDYTHPGAFDMEAAGFLSVLNGNGYCLKIISDNSDQPGHSIKAKWVSQLISNQLDYIDQLINQLSKPT